MPGRRRGQRKSVQWDHVCGEASVKWGELCGYLEEEHSQQREQLAWWLREQECGCRLRRPVGRGGGGQAWLLPGLSRKAVSSE